MTDCNCKCITGIIGFRNFLLHLMPWRHIHILWLFSLAESRYSRFDLERSVLKDWYFKFLCRKQGYSPCLSNIDSRFLIGLKVKFFDCKGVGATSVENSIGFVIDVLKPFVKISSGNGFNCTVTESFICIRLKIDCSPTYNGISGINSKHYQNNTSEKIQKWHNNIA